MIGQPQIRVGDIASLIRASVTDAGVPLDLTAATVLTLKLRKPNGTVLERAAVRTNPPGVDGIVQYETADGDIDEAGPWQGQVYVELGTQKFHTTVFSFSVADNLS